MKQRVVLAFLLIFVLSFNGGCANKKPVNPKAPVPQVSPTNQVLSNKPDQINIWSAGQEVPVDKGSVKFQQLIGELASQLGGKLSSVPKGATPAELAEARQTSLEYVFPGGTTVNLQNFSKKITSVSRVTVPLQKLRGTIIIESSSAKEQYGPIDPRGLEMGINR